MPYKFEYTNKRIPKELDRRRKLTESDKEQIRKLYGKISQRKLAKMFNVSRRSIVFIGRPETKERDLLLRKMKGGSKFYYDKEKQRQYKKNHRKYKQSLSNQNKLE